MFGETHFGAVKAMNDQCMLVAGIHRDATDLTYVGHGQNVGDGVWIKPDFAEVREISNKLGVLKSAVRDGAEDVIAGSNVPKHVAVSENGDSRL